jgi:flagellar motor protein MotB
MLKPGTKEKSLIIPATFTFDARDRNTIGKWQLVIWDYSKKVFFNIGGTGEPPVSFIWDGKGKNGEYVQTGDMYYYSFIAYDSLGNMAKTKTSYQIRLTFSSDALFERGEANVKISAYGTLKSMKTVIDKFPQSEINIVGHTDDRDSEAGVKYKDNNHLSKARAEAVKFYMVNLLGLSESKISTTGLGHTQPIADNRTPEGRSKNRRVEIFIKSTVYE